MNQNTEYEKFAQEVYQGLINADGVKTIDVKHNVKLVGKSGQGHQIDVYWEYEYVGIKHKVAIECKNYNSVVPIGKVRDFYGVLSDLNNVAGIMVTKIGYQDGAKKYADTYGIDLKELRSPNEQDWEGRVKTIVLQMTMVLPKIKQCIPLLDTDWIKANIEFSKEGPKNYQLQLQGMSDELIVYDENGRPITNFHELDSKLPCLDQEVTEDIEHIYTFDNGYMDFNPLGRLKINGVKYVYDVIRQEMSPITIDAQRMVKAILKDALSGDIKFIRRNAN